MSSQDWSRLVRKGGRKAEASAKSISIEAIVSFYGGEIRQGRSASVKCCMHDDTRRSAVMNTFDNLYWCHTCGKGGNSVNVVMEKENLGFQDAIKRAGEIIAGSGFPIQQQSRRGNRKVSRRTWNI